jgi:hypothetical protein
MSYFLEGAFHNDREVDVLRTKQDIEKFIETLLEAGWEYTAATIYAIDEKSGADPDHEVLIGVDKTTNSASLRYAGDGDWYSKGTTTSTQPLTYAYFGTEHVFPADSAIPLPTAITALDELLSTGGARPTNVKWQPAQP